MSERGALSLAHPDGDTVAALRPARQADHLGRPRHIPLVDRACRQLAAPPVLRPLVLENDAMDLGNPGAGLLASRMAVGAGRWIVLDVRHLADDGQALVTPVILSPDGSLILATLETRASQASPLRLGGVGSLYPAPRLVWELAGPSVLAVHVAGLAGHGNGVEVRGGVLPLGAAVLQPPRMARFVPVNTNQNLAPPDWAASQFTASLARMD